MPKRVELRPLTEEERTELERLRRSRKAEQRLVERARIVLLLADGGQPTEVAAELRRSQPMVYHWLHRFNEQGLAGLEDAPRAGRPLTYSEEERGRMIATARTRPEKLGLDFGHWTLNRLVEYVNEQLGVPISRSQLGEVLRAEGLRWYQEKTYFTESPDPQFAEKRGRL
jgi:transposase